MFDQQYSQEPPELPETPDTKPAVTHVCCAACDYGIFGEFMEHTVVAQHNLTSRGLFDEVLDWFEV